MPQGLTSSPAYFQQLMNVVLEGHSNAMAYMDVAIAYSRDWQSHLRHVDDMLQRIRDLLQTNVSLDAHRWCS